MLDCSNLVVFDVDGTLMVKGKHYIPKSALLSIRKLQKQGVTTVIATGRSKGAIDEIIRSTGVDYYIADNGSTIYNKKFDEVYHCYISIEERYELEKYFKENFMGLALRFSEGSYDISHPEQFADFAKAFFKNGKRNGKDPKDLDPNERPTSGICRIENDRIENVKKKFTNITFNETLNGVYYDFQNKESSKSKALIKLCSIVHMSINRTIAIGDGHNDIDLLKTAAFSVAMGNAIDEVKRIANYVTDDIENDGIMKAIEYIEKETR